MKGAQHPPLLGPCLLWPWSPISATAELLFDMSQSSLRGHSLKLNKKRVRLDVAKFCFSNRVVNEWNILDEEIISGCSLPVFIQKLDRHLRDKRGHLSSCYSWGTRSRNISRVVRCVKLSSVYFTTICNRVTGGKIYTQHSIDFRSVPLQELSSSWDGRPWPQ